jgi:hypothetical protein
LDTRETEDDLELKNEAEESKLHRMVKVRIFLELYQDSLHLCAIHRESWAQNKHLTTVGYTSDTEEIMKASWSYFQQHCTAAFTLSESSPLPPELSAEDLPAEQTEVLNVH